MIPSEYFSGEEYFEDTEEIDVIISCYFRSVAVIDEITLSFSNGQITIGQNGNHLNLRINRKISKNLFNSLNKTPKSTTYLIGYVDEVIPFINKALLQQKYLSGHILLTTYSDLDLFGITVTKLDDNTTVALVWPKSIPPFPLVKKLPDGGDEVFIRDYIDAMTCYFDNNFDECIRKIITSLENFFIYAKIKGDFSPHPNFVCRYFELFIQKIHDRYGLMNVEIKRGTFNSKLHDCLNEHNYPQWRKHTPIVEENIRFLYKVRNSIVHKKYRLSEEDKWICCNGIVTLSYFFQNSFVDKSVSRYISALNMQFSMLGPTYQGISLDKLRELKTRSSNPKPINSPQELDNSIFLSLKIGEKQKKEFFKKMEN
jgi:hypothetical protein